MEKEEKYREVLSTIEQLHPGKLRLGVVEVSALTGDAPGTIYNRISKSAVNPYPIRFDRAGGRPRALIHDVALFLAGM